MNPAGTRPGPILGAILLAALGAANHSCRTSYPVRGSSPAGAQNPPAPDKSGSSNRKIADAAPALPGPVAKEIPPQPLTGAAPDLRPAADSRPQPAVPGEFRVAPAPPADPAGTLRVGIALERDRIRIGGFDETYRIRTTKGEVSLHAPIEAAPRPGAAGSTLWHLQIGSYTERSTAIERAAETTRKLGLPVRVGDASLAGTYPILAGDFPDRDKTLAAKPRMAALGYSDGFPVATSELGGEAGFELVDAQGNRWIVSGREIDLLPAEGLPATFSGDGYHGTFRIRIGTKGKLHLVNVVLLEEYLKGVVPAEMGPKAFGEIEALKAQAVAARSYAIRRKGESQTEGFDLCATPRCQVYKGIAVEDPLTNRAVAETSGLVVTYQGKVADTLFTSTCGGHTESVGNVFPERSEPYLIAVPCSIEGKPLPPITGIAGPPGREPAARAAALERWLEMRGVKFPKEISTDFVLQASNVIRRSLGAPALPGRPRNVTRGVLIPTLLETFRLAEAARILDRDADRGLLVPGAGEDELFGRSLELLRRFDWDSNVAESSATSPLALSDWLATAGLLSENVGLYERIEGRILAEPSAGWMIRSAAGAPGGASEWVPVPQGKKWLLWRKNGDRFEGSSNLVARPGDKITAWVDGPSLLGLAVEIPDAGPAADRESSWSRWTRRFRKSQLLTKIRERRPITDIRSLEVVGRSATGRVTKLEVRTGGEPVVLSGIDVRFALDLPESLVAIVPAAPVGDDPTWLFLGRGWGHGVGLCQWGAYGKALAGEEFRQILTSYFPGTELKRLEEVR